MVTKEFPIYEVIDDRLSAEFLAALLRRRCYQRAFRAITTGHSNRRRTQVGDFESLDIAFPSSEIDQRKIIEEIMASRKRMRTERQAAAKAADKFDRIIDGLGAELAPSAALGSDG